MAINPKVFKQVRKALGLSQQELADAIGLSRVTINKMERGRLRRGIPDEIAERLMSLQKRPTTRLKECSRCGGSGFSGRGTGYGDVCAECGGQKYLPDDAGQKRPAREEPTHVDAAWDAHEAANVKSDDHLWDNEEEDDQ